MSEQTDPIDLEAMLEALIFVSKDPLSSEQMVEILSASEVACEAREVKQALKDLYIKWQDPDRICGRGLSLEKIASGYVFKTAMGQAVVVKNLVPKKPLELTKSHLEVISIVAYRQPITRVDMDEIRGVDSSGALKKLLQLKLVKILGKSEGLGRPLLYGTTKQFLEFFSLNSLHDLPTLKQFESLGQPDEAEAIDPHDERLSFKDLFQDKENTSMFSEEVQRLSDEALKSLDEALLHMESVEKIQAE